MFYEKALIDNITLSHSLNMCKSGDRPLQKEGNIFVKRRYHLIRIYLSQGEGKYIFYHVVSFVNRCALHGKLTFWDHFFYPPCESQFSELYCIQFSLVDICNFGRFWANFLCVCKNRAWSPKL